MKAIIKILFYIAVVISLLSAGCEYEAPEGDSYNFVVVSSGGTVSGYYIVNGDPDSQTYFTTVLVSGTSLTNPYFEYKKNLVSPSSVRIYACQDSSSVTSVQIYVYENSNEVANASDTITTSGDTVSATLYHEFNSSDTSSK